MTIDLDVQLYFVAGAIVAGAAILTDRDPYSTGWKTAILIGLALVVLWPFFVLCVLAERLWKGEGK